MSPHMNNVSRCLTLWGTVLIQATTVRETIVEESYSTSEITSQFPVYHQQSGPVNGRVMKSFIEKANF